MHTGGTTDKTFEILSIGPKPFAVEVSMWLRWDQRPQGVRWKHASGSLQRATVQFFGGPKPDLVLVHQDAVEAEFVFRTFRQNSRHPAPKFVWCGDLPGGKSEITPAYLDLHGHVLTRNPLDYASLTTALAGVGLELPQGLL